MMLTIGQYINIARNKRNMTLNQLAEKSGVPKDTICSWIYHGHYPSIVLLICVADALDMSLDEVVGRKR